MCLSEHNPFGFASWNYVHRSVKLTTWNIRQVVMFVIKLLFYYIWCQNHRNYLGEFLRSSISFTLRSIIMLSLSGGFYVDFIFALMIKYLHYVH